MPSLRLLLMKVLVKCPLALQAQAAMEAVGAQAYMVSIGVCVKRLPVSVVHVFTQQVIPELKHTQLGVSVYEDSDLDRQVHGWMLNHHGQLVVIRCWLSPQAPSHPQSCSQGPAPGWPAWSELSRAEGHPVKASCPWSGRSAQPCWLPDP